MENIRINHFFRILDDIEMYEQQIPFELMDYVALSSFINMFSYKAIQDNIFGELNASKFRKLN